MLTFVDDLWSNIQQFSCNRLHAVPPFFCDIYKEMVPQHLPGYYATRHPILLKTNVSMCREIRLGMQNDPGLFTS
jgi:hypothetical protein